MHTFHPINQYKFRRRATRNVHSKRGELYQAISQGQNISSFCVTSCHLFALPIFLWFATSAALSTWKHEYGRTHVTFWRLRREKKKSREDRGSSVRKYFFLPIEMKKRVVTRKERTHAKINHEVCSRSVLIIAIVPRVLYIFVLRSNDWTTISIVIHCEFGLEK